MAHTDTMPAKPQIRQVAADRPWAWLAAGWQDIWNAPGLSLSYGALFAVVSLVLTLGLVMSGLEYLLPPLAAGFMLLGPMLAVGLYETSRRLQTGEPVTLGSALLVATSSPTQLAFLGVLLMLFLLAWIRIATLLFAVFFGTLDFPPLSETPQMLFFTWEGLGLLVVGTGVGAVFAIIVFAMSVVSVPMLMVRDVDAITAIITSVQTVRANVVPLALWAWLIVVLTAVGFVPAFLGLIVTFPLVGHATWHAYRDLIE